MSDRTCNRCKSPLTRGQKKYCSHTCANTASMGAKAEASRAAHPPKQCDINGCDNLARSGTAALCAKHYHRVYRNGTLDRKPIEPRYDDVTGRRYGTLIAIRRTGQQWLCTCDCGNTRRASAGELNRTGDKNTCGTPGRHLNDFVQYHAAHERVKRERGPASNHRCADCGRAAYHWSYDHEDPDEVVSNEERIKGVAYSLKTEHYVARCVPCHKVFDLGRKNANDYTSLP